MSSAPPPTAGFEPTVVVVEHDPAWPAAFADEASALREALGDLLVRIEHVGSTSVDGLAGKPIIDTQIAVARVDVAELSRLVAPLGYANVPWFADATYPFFAKPAAGMRTHHLHACLPGSDEEFRHLAVRDFLRAHPDEAGVYGSLKRDLFIRFHGDRQGYVDGKDGFMKALEARAVAWARPAA
ncbi:MAG: hypothetical protein QOE86_2029 [Solirubrobacteraceae bacterium]|jgi:GrpB-like predicted nucleotidyltransferase (UPF0157 family)|nr:hypothetical protein [Solirubrobacteraceae bacterium]